MSGIRRIGLFAFLFLAAVLLCGPATGKPARPAPPPPPPPPVDGGTIYYAFGGNLCSMNPDGSGKTALFAADTPAAGDLDRGGAPSLGTHWCATHQKAERWFLRVLAYKDEESDAYPNKRSRGELFATCEKGHSIRLTEAADLEPANSMTATYVGTPVFLLAEPRWTAADGTVTYLAKRWAAGAVVEWGLYAVTIDPDDLAGHAPADPGLLDVPVDLTNTLTAEGEPTWHGGIVNAPYDWSPDGTEIVMERHGDSAGLWYGAAESDFELSLIHDGFDPKWSPASREILFLSKGVWRMNPDPETNPDGTATLVVAMPDSTKRTVYNLDYAFWSPNATHIVYMLGSRSSNGNTSQDIYRVAAGGTGVTKLTGDLIGFPWPVGWR